MRVMEVERPFCNAVAAPVFGADGRVFVAGVCKGEGSEPGSPVVYAFDSNAGRLEWSTSLPTSELAFDLATSLVVPRADGGVWLAVHEFDQGVVIHGMDVQGRADQRIEMPGEYPLCGAGDAGSKVMLRLLGNTAGVLCGWTYRQVRHYGMTWYNNAGVSVWSASEWPLAGDETVVVGCTVPQRFTSSGASAEPMQIVARDVRDGSVLWKLDTSDTTVASLAAGVLYLVDRSRALTDAREQQRVIEAEYLGTVADSALDALLVSALPRFPMHVRALDAATGVERWSSACGAQILGVCASASGVAILHHERDGTIRLRVLDSAGRHAGNYEVDSAIPSDPRRMPSDVATLMDAGDSVIVLTATRWLRIAYDTTLQSQGVLPAPCFAFEPRISDRWLTRASAARVANSHLVLRSQRSVWFVPV
jgi:outer membrane protein assembly factor BamB